MGVQCGCEAWLVELRDRKWRVLEMFSARVLVKEMLG